MKLFIPIVTIFFIMSCTKNRQFPNDNRPIIAPDSFGLGSLVINEYTPKGKVDTNEFGVQGKWIELYNPGNKNIEIDSNFYMTDTLPWPEKFHVKLISVKQIVPPKGFLVVWTDNCDTASNQKIIHTNFSLNASGGSIGLFWKNTNGKLVVIDSTSYPDYNSMPKGVAFGHFPDGTIGFKQLTARTPGAPNKL